MRNCMRWQSRLKKVATARTSKISRNRASKKVQPLHDLFASTASAFCHDRLKIEKYWAEIMHAYTHKSRFYHNLNHLNHLLMELEAVRERICDWQMMVFTLFYHDLIYNPVRSDNEEKSAIRAAARLTDIGFPKNRILLCADAINATKSHTT